MMRGPGVGQAGERRGYKGVRRRRWGKWVSEIRVRGTRERLWLGSYATPEAAAVAYDTAVYFLRGGGGDVAALNFPERAAAAYGGGAGAGRLSPRSVQRVASDAGMAADAQAQLVAAWDSAPAPVARHADRTGSGSARGGSTRPHGDTDAYARMGHANTSRNSASASREHLVSGEISVDDVEIHFDVTN
ncbi:ethylene-responsive transcription factor ERF008-like [Phragmites australis]|uniref:ethylene-responsive transcription factor ERF008-like n=1 Tax=Phragmites australis TaxID=29695 RepID=UPI002D7A0835|nr:ethylene-responsive transcription factor ERF008-like [Phragmites australis]